MTQQAQRKPESDRGAALLRVPTLMRRSMAIPADRSQGRSSMQRLAKRAEDLVLLKCVVRVGSINKAARELSISQSALSRRLERLEEGLGVPLLERSQHGVRFASGVEGIGAHLDDIEGAIEAMAEWIIERW